MLLTSQNYEVSFLIYSYCITCLEESAINEGFCGDLQKEIHHFQ